MITEELAEMGCGQSAQSGEGGDVVRLIENLPDALDGGQQTTLAAGDSEVLCEMEALISNCTTTWTTRNGVCGCLVTGKGNYADKSIFLPAAGNGDRSYLINPGFYGYYWTSALSSANSGYSNAWGLYFDSSNFNWISGFRCEGWSVRPVREFAK